MHCNLTWNHSGTFILIFFFFLSLHLHKNLILTFSSCTEDFSPFHVMYSKHLTVCKVPALLKMFSGALHWSLHALNTIRSPFPSSLGIVFATSTRLKTPWGGFNSHVLCSNESPGWQSADTWNLDCVWCFESTSQTNIFTCGICAFTCSKTVGSPQVLLEMPSKKPLSFPEENLLYIILSCCVSVGSSCVFDA